MREDVLGAEQLLERLSAFLRAVLAEPGREQISLREELAILDHYVEVERSRFSDRLRIQHEFPPEMLEAALPRMILQPLVENAIKHGVAMRRGSGLIKIEAQKTEGLVMLSVSDDGPGWPEKVNSSTGETHIGLANTRLRLEKAYGDRHRVDLLRSTQGGAVVTLQFPYSRYRDVQ
jgi:LytS/YehU family sensor histidine kinase